MLVYIYPAEVSGIRMLLSFAFMERLRIWGLRSRWKLLRDEPPLVRVMISVTAHLWASAFMLELRQDGDNVIDGSSSNVHASIYRFVLP